jgi:hypothetical protein
MNKYLQEIKRIIAAIMIFILLLQQFGCVNSKVISTADLPSYNPKYAYAIQCDKSVYLSEKVVVTNDALSGKVFNPDWEVLQTENFIRIYTSTDSLVNINLANILSLPISDIIKVESIGKAHGKTTGLVIGDVF